MHTLTRRNLVIASAAGVCAGACGCQMFGSASSGKTLVDIGSRADYPKTGVSDKFAKSDKLIVVRTGDRIYATTAVCTHRGCTLAWKDNAIRCPCHGSVFGLDGQRTAGPAKAPLERFAIAMNGQRIVVDKSRSFHDGQWDDPSAFLRV